VRVLVTLTLCHPVQWTSVLHTALRFRQLNSVNAFVGVTLLVWRGYPIGAVARLVGCFGGPCMPLLLCKVCSRLPFTPLHPKGTIKGTCGHSFVLPSPCCRNPYLPHLPKRLRGHHLTVDASHEVGPMGFCVWGFVCVAHNPVFERC
jgi:hypothetical protein